jgi:hypothetical protein
MRLPRDLRTWLPIIIFIAGLSLPLVVYSFTLAPDLSWAHGSDGGDLIVAAQSLGVSHPPGYPAYTLFAHLFTLLPWGSVAFRVNLLSAIGAAVAAGIISLIVIMLSKHERKWNVLLGALMAGWSLAFMPLLWGQAVIAEVYTVHAACVALTILLAIRINNRPSNLAALILGLAWGVAFGFHVTSIFLLPIIIWGFSRHNIRPKSVFLLGSLLIGFGIASLQWFYAALRAGHGAFTWGDPTTLDGWWWLTNASLYKGYVFSFPLDGWFARIFYIAKLFLTGFGPIAVFLGLIGLINLGRSRLGLVLSMGITAIGSIVFAIGYNTTDSDRYTIPALIIFCIVIGFGSIRVAEGFRARWGQPALVVMWIVVFMLLAGNILFYWPRISLKTDHDAMAFGKMVMMAAPADSIILTDDDRETFTLWYFRYVLKQRDDIIVMDKGLLAFDWYQRQVGVSASEAALIVESNETSSSHPVCQVIIGDQSPAIECQSEH